VHDSNSADDAQAGHPPFPFLVHAVPVLVCGEAIYRARSKVFELLASGELDGVKDGKRTLVTVESIRRFQAKMPPAVFKKPAPPRYEGLKRLHAKQAVQRAQKRAERRKAGSAVT
jgi:hypothetical protein